MNMEIPFGCVNWLAGRYIPQPSGHLGRFLTAAMGLDPVNAIPILRWVIGREADLSGICQLSLVLYTESYRYEVPIHRFRLQVTKALHCPTIHHITGHAITSVLPTHVLSNTSAILSAILQKISTNTTQEKT